MSKIPAGTHKAKVKSWGFTTSSKGTPAFTALFECQGETLYWNQYFTANTTAISKEIFVKQLRSLGYQENDLNVLGDMEKYPDALDKNSEIDLKVYYETYNGEQKVRCEPANAGSAKNDPKAAATITAMADLKAILMKEPARERKVYDPENPTMNDVPF